MIIGIVVVFGAVLAGYLMERGNLKVLMQPAELVIMRPSFQEAESHIKNRGAAPAAPGGTEAPAAAERPAA